MVSLPSRKTLRKFSPYGPNQICIPCRSCGRPLYFPQCRKDERERRFCDMACREAWRTTYQQGRNSANYQRGITLNNGRVYVYRPTHPRRSVRGYVLRSRIVMENLIGRCLTPIEVVHHLDLNRLNDSPSNLVLCADQRTHMRLYHNTGGRKK